MKKSDHIYYMAGIFLQAFMMIFDTALLTNPNKYDKYVYAVMLIITLTAYVWEKRKYKAIEKE